MSFGAPKMQPTPPPPLPVKSTQDGLAASTATLAQVAAGGYQSLNKTGGLGVPNVNTSSARLLGM